MDFRQAQTDRLPAKKTSFVKSWKTKAKKVLGWGSSSAVAGKLNGGPAKSNSDLPGQDEPYSDFYSSIKEEQQMRERIRDSLECAICTDIMLDPVSLDCGHTFCLHCMAHDYNRRTDGTLICCVCRDGSSKVVAISRSLRDVIESAFPGEAKHRRECLTVTDRQAIARLLSHHKKTPVQIQIAAYWKYANYILAGTVIFLAWFFYPVE